MRFGYKVLDHPSDLFIEVRRRTLRALYSGMAAAVFDRIRNGKPPSPIQMITLEAEGADPEDLLIRFLNEAISIGQTKKLDLIRFRVVSLRRTRIRVEAAACPLNADRPPTAEVKAATYHGLKIEKLRGGSYRAVVLFDL